MEPGLVLMVALGLRLKPVVRRIVLLAGGAILLGACGPQVPPKTKIRDLTEERSDVRSPTPRSFTEREDVDGSLRSRFRSLFGLAPKPDKPPPPKSKITELTQARLSIDVDWLKYKDTEFGYQFTYPENLYSRDQGKINDRVLNVTSFVVSADNPVVKSGLIRTGEVAITVKVTTDSFETVSRRTSSSSERLVVAGQPGLITRGKNSSGDEMITLYVANPDGGSISLVIKASVFGSDADQLVRRIIESFSFAGV